jgi:hypothetical protein
LANGREEIVNGPTINYKMTGGLSQRRIQQRIENAVSDHIREVAARLEAIVFEEDIPRIVLGGTRSCRPSSKTTSQTVPGSGSSLWSGWTYGCLRTAVSRGNAGCTGSRKVRGARPCPQVRDNALAGGLGAFGEKPVRHALDQGAVDILLLDPTFATPEKRDEMTTLALSTGGGIEFVEESDDLKRMRGVAALLRWKPETLPATASDEGKGGGTSRNAGRGAGAVRTGRIVKRPNEEKHGTYFADKFYDSHRGIYDRRLRLYLAGSRTHAAGRMDTVLYGRRGSPSPADRMSNEVRKYRQAYLDPGAPGKKNALRSPSGKPGPLTGST